MFDRSIVAFDIETIPDPDVGRRLHALTGTDAEVVREMVQKRLEETDGKREYPHLPFQRIACVCVAALDPRTGKATIRSVGAAAWRDERSHIEGFFRFVSDSGAPALVSWNGSGFDLAVLRYRAMHLGIAAPDFYRTSDEPSDERHWHRYRNVHVDLMDLLADRGASTRVGLGTLASLVGLPGKIFLERPIYDHVIDGEAERVVEYCKLDTVQTLLLFLLWAFHTGRLSRADLRRHVASVRTTITELRYPGWRTVEATLESWPTW